MFSKRIEDAIEHAYDTLNLNDVELLKLGRHFRMTSDAKLIVGRNMEENERIKHLSIAGDTILEAVDYVGPTCLLRSKTHDRSVLNASASILLRYSDSPKGTKCKVRALVYDKEEEICVKSASDDEIAKLRI
jgi:hypothetical protein